MGNNVVPEVVILQVEAKVVSSSMKMMKNDKMETKNETQENDAGKSAMEWYVKISASALAISLGILMIVISLPDISVIDVKWNTPLSQLGLALIISGLTYITFQHVFDRGNREFTESTVKDAVSDISQMLEEVEEQLNDLTKQNKILHGAFNNNIIQIYAKRSEGLQDIQDDIRKSNNVKIMGISLRAYFNPAEKSFVEMESVLDNISNNDERKIQILIINPNCEQAAIRAERESDEDFSNLNPYEESGLYSDVWQTIRYLSKKQKEGRVEAKVYNSAPSCFLVITDEHTYVEQYHYGIKRSGLVGGNFPLLKFPTTIKPGRKLNESTISEHLNGHFDYVWDDCHKRSLPLNYLLDLHMVGTSRSAWECGIVNIFQSRSIAKDRIKVLMKNEKKEIRLIGISLRDFFHAGNDYYTVLREISSNKHDDGNISIKALLLDPLCEQGVLRSQREEPGIERGNLYSEVVTSLRSIDRLKENGALIDVRLYQASTNCFAIQGDEGVLIEQYHYGSAEPDATILGGKIPLLEFHKKSPTFQEIKGHFDYIWDKASINIEEWRKSSGENIQQDNAY